MTNEQLNEIEARRKRIHSNMSATRGAEDSKDFVAFDAPKLIAYIRELEASNRWRDVETELPVADTDVLVCTDRGAVWVARLSESGIWWQDRYALDVTHWRPLPAPPQETK